MKTVTIVGVGALGSHVIQALRNLPDDLKVIDFDRVESKNCSSQFHSKTAVGKSKVQSLQQTMSFLFGRKLTVVPHKLTADNYTQLLGDSSLLIDCLDNAEGRRLVQGYASRTNTPCVHGGLDANGSFGRVVWTEDFVIDEGAAGAATCENGAHLPWITLVSAHLAYAAQQFVLTGKKRRYQITLSGTM